MRKEVEKGEEWTAAGGVGHDSLYSGLIFHCLGGGGASILFENHTEVRVFLVCKK